MPRRPRSHELEDQARDRIRAAFNAKGWTVEDLRKDYGEDLLVRIFRGGVATPLMFFVQCKGTESVHRYLTREKEVAWPIKRRHVDHWERFAEPVILSVWNARTGLAYWECVQSFLATQGGRLFNGGATNRDTLRVPIGNPLDELGLTRIESITRNRFGQVEVERMGSQELVRILENTLDVKIEYSARAGLLSFETPDNQVAVHAFGNTAEALQEIEEHLGCPAEQSLNRSLTLIRQWFENATEEQRKKFLQSLEQSLQRRKRGEDDEIAPLSQSFLGA
jgi:hypothetical protein